jgi:hypothetical protein
MTAAIYKNPATERSIAGDTLIFTSDDGDSVAEFTRMGVGYWSVWMKVETDKPVGVA